MDARTFIRRLPATMRVSLTHGSTTVTAGRASISSDTIINLYGDDKQYTGSFVIDERDFSTPPEEQTRVTVGGTQYLIIGVHRYPGDLRRLDVGGKYGR